MKEKKSLKWIISLTFVLINIIKLKQKVCIISNILYNYLFKLSCFSILFCHPLEYLENFCSISQTCPSEDPQPQPNSGTFTLYSPEVESYRKKLAVHPHWLAEINSGQFGARAWGVAWKRGGDLVQTLRAYPTVALKAAGGRAVRWLFNFCSLQKVGTALCVCVCEVLRRHIYSLCLLRKANSKLKAPP